MVWINNTERTGWKGIKRVTRADLQTSRKRHWHPFVGIRKRDGYAMEFSKNVVTAE
jgi:hypothetical protein